MSLLELAVEIERREPTQAGNQRQEGRLSGRPVASQNPGPSPGGRGARGALLSALLQRAAELGRQPWVECIEDGLPDSRR